MAGEHSVLSEAKLLAAGSIRAKRQSSSSDLQEIRTVMVSCVIRTLVVRASTLYANYLCIYSTTVLFDKIYDSRASLIAWMAY